MISLLIPTMNRSEFVIRLLKYYDQLKFKHGILIGDSSNIEEFERTSKTVKELDGRLNVKHYYYPNLNNYAVTSQLIQKVQTPYASFLPDDDFYVPEAIEKCMSFLNDHPEYSCAWGKSVIFTLKDKGAHGRFNALGVSNSNTAYSVEDDKAKERLFFHIKKYTSVFVGVCRTEMFKKALRNVWEMGKLAETKDIKWWTVEQFGEIVTSFSLVVQGKIKTIDCLYWIRQAHDRRYLFPDIFDWITSPNWFVCYEMIARQIKEDIIAKDNLSLPEAEMVWKKGFWMYLRRGIYRKYHGRYVLPWTIRSRIKKKLKQAGVLYDIFISARNNWRVILSKVTAAKKKISLQTILNPSSPDYEYFLPVYKLVTKSDEKKQ